MITVFSKNDCGYCDKIKGILNENKIKHKILVLDKDYSLSEVKNTIADATGKEVTKLTFPAVFDKAHYVGGCDEMMDYMLEHKFV